MAFTSSISIADTSMIYRNIFSSFCKCELVNHGSFTVPSLTIKSYMYWRGEKHFAGIKPGLAASQATVLAFGP